MRRLLVALLVVVGLGACGGGGSGSHPAVGPLGVLVADFAFQPSTLKVHVGDTVTWTFDQPDAPHNVVSLSGPASFNSGAPKGSGRWAFRFTAPGTYTYICLVHPAMKGTVTVTP